MSSKQPKPPSDVVMAAVTDEQDLKFTAMASKSRFVQHLLEMAKHVPGLTAKSFLPSMLVAGDALMGPVEFTYVTEVDADGRALNTGRNISGLFLGNVAPTGSVKTYTMNVGPRALGTSVAALRNSKFARVRAGVAHIPVCKDGSTPCLLSPP
jgi:hypothetical protein